MLMVILGAGASHDSYGSLAAGNPGGGALSPEEHRPPLTKDLFEEGPSVNSTTRLVPECAGWVGHMRRLIRQLDKEKVQSVEEILAHLALHPILICQSGPHWPFDFSCSTCSPNASTSGPT